MSDDAEDELLRSVALRNASAILLARHRVEGDLLRANQALEARTRELADALSVMKATLESTADGILVTDNAGKVTTFNQKFLEIWGLPHDTVAGGHHGDLARQLAHLFPQPDEVVDRIDAVYGSTAPTLDTLLLADGRSFERFSRPQYIDGCSVGRVWSYRDITTRKHAEDALRARVESERTARVEIDRVSRLKDEFLATLSHELRTPLTAILGWAKVLLLKRDDAASRERGLAAIARNAKAQARLIDDLLDMNRIVSGKLRLEVQPTDVASVVEAAVEAARPSAEAKGISLHTVLDPLAGPVSGDPNRLQQVVWNLLSNAVKFTPRNGKIEVRLERIDSHLEITVRDDGIGIEAHFLPQVFDRFRQADASTTRSQGGLGLGLSIARQLVELHGGSVRASSDGPGHGAAFVVSLPLTAMRHEPPREHRAADGASASTLPAHPKLAGLKILIVDDEPDARQLVEQLLRDCDAEVHSAASAAEALALLESVRPDLLLSDIGMPDCDGYQFIQQVRRLAAERGGQTPAIALTAFARNEDRVRTMVAGYQVHLAKPVEPHELLAAVASLSSRSAAER
ncbi:MAG TPA: ATP-binding protein [Caldimonas sp.]|jgi:PAS domain S-box-containing protein